MVSKITIFEPHLEGVQIGPTTLPDGFGSEESSEQIDDPETTESTSGSWGRRIVGMIVIGSFVAYLAYRWSSMGDTTPSDIHVEETPPEERTVAAE